MMAARSKMFWIMVILMLIAIVALAFMASNNVQLITDNLFNPLGHCVSSCGSTL